MRNLVTTLALTALCACQGTIDRSKIGLTRIAVSGSTALTDLESSAGAASVSTDTTSSVYGLDFAGRLSQDSPIELGGRVLLDHQAVDAAGVETELLQLDFLGTLRAYLWQEETRFQPFVEAFAGAGLINAMTDTGGSLVEDDDVGPVVGASAGFNAFITESVSVEVAARYRYQEFVLLGADNQVSSIGLLIGLAAHF